MSDGFIYWYRTDWEPADAQVLLQSLGARELSLSNPATGRITRITNGPDSWGEQVPVDRESLANAAGLTGIEEVNFQLWANSDADVYTRFRRLRGDVVVAEFGLDGLRVDEREQAVRTIVGAIRSELGRSIGFVIDRLGVAEDVDWDSVVTKGAAQLTAWPDTLAVRPEVAARLPELAGVEGREESPLLVFGRTALLA